LSVSDTCARCPEKSVCISEVRRELDKLDSRRDSKSAIFFG
jgi:hypothetical protein